MNKPAPAQAAGRSAHLWRGDLLRCLVALDQQDRTTLLDLLGFEAVAAREEPITAASGQVFQLPASDVVPHYVATLPKIFRSRLVGLAQPKASKLAAGNQANLAAPSGRASVPEVDAETRFLWRPHLLGQKPWLTEMVERTVRRSQPSATPNIDRLIDLIANGQPPCRHCALQTRLVWNGSELAVFANPDNTPLHGDFYQLIEVAYRRSRGRVRIWLWHPDMGWSFYHPTGKGVAKSPWQRMDQQPDWRQFTGLVAGKSPGTLDERVARLPDRTDRADNPKQRHWDWAGRYAPPPAPEAARRGMTQILLALLCLTVVVDAQLLRALRKLLPARHDIELDIWNHEAVDHLPGFIALKRRARHALYGQLAQLDLPLRQCAARLITAHHAWHGLEVAAEEAQLAKVYAPGAEAFDPGMCYTLMAQHLRAAPDTDQHRMQAAYLNRMAFRLDEHLWEAAPEFALAWAVTKGEALANNDDLPPHLPMPVLQRSRARLLAQDSEPQLQIVRVVREGVQIWLERETYQGVWRLTTNRAEREKAAAQYYALPEGMMERWQATQELYWRTLPDGAWTRAELRARLELTPHLPVEINDGFTRCHVEQIRPPPWAIAIGDDPIGRYALVQVGNEQLRFRPMRPGAFWMGSPVQEAGRKSNEPLRHPAYIQHEFWLAETVCSVALWREVMGNHKAIRRASARAASQPVVGISWDDVNEFLGRIASWLEGGEVRLPTETEWEYACRAGSASPVSFGEVPRISQINFNCTTLAEQGAKWRKATVAVTDLPCNAWGLYQMHGNVWEWCADAWPVVNEPPGWRRVIRGGSWRAPWQAVRAAARDAYPACDGRDDIGFRLVIQTASKPT